MKTRPDIFLLLITLCMFLPVLSAHADPLGERIALELCIMGEGLNPTIEITEEEAAQWRSSAIQGHVFTTLFDGVVTKNFDGDFTKEAGCNVGQCVRSSLNYFAQLSCYGSDVELIEGTTTLRRFDVKKILCP
jgi:hypothetical protein